MGLFDLIPGAKKVKKQIETDLSKKTGTTVKLPTPTNKQVVTAAAKGAVTVGTTAAAVASLAVPGLNIAGAATLAGTAIAGDKLIAAIQTGGAAAKKAQDVYDSTKSLASAGNADAKKALSVLSTVAKDRVALGVPSGVAQPLTASGAKALLSFASAPKLAVTTTGKVAVTTPPPKPAVTAVLKAVAAAPKPAAATSVASALASRAIDPKATFTPPAAASLIRPVSVATLAAPSAFLQFAPDTKIPAALSDAAAINGQLVTKAGRLDFRSSKWKPVSAGTAGAVAGLVVDTQGRIAFQENWVMA